MSDAHPPAYPATEKSQPYNLDDTDYHDEKSVGRREKREITLFHTLLTGDEDSPPSDSQQQLLFPPTTTLLRIWSGSDDDGIHGIEYVTHDGASQALGTRTGPHMTDHRVPAGTYVTAIHVSHSGGVGGSSDAKVRAVRFSCSNGTQTPWCGRRQSGEESVHRGTIVGIFGQQTDHAGILARFGVITTTEDYSVFAQFHQDTQANGIAAAAVSRQHAESSEKHTEQQQQQQQQQQQHVDGRGKYTWDTGRWTRNRGIGIRWNHERHRVEIYQGSNDATQY